jgi:formylglycine-generating enzyme required for sulfatase activity
MARIALIALSIFLVLFPHCEGHCSNIKITNPALGTLSGGSTTVTFDVTWTNSWRSTSAGAPAPNNWDAAWVFVKFRKNGGNWAHASLNNTGHSMGTGTAATYSVGYPDTSSAFNIATNPGVGVFIYRSGDGSGTFSLTGASLSWNYLQDGVVSGDTVEIRVFGIEMVYVPTGAFFAGDNATSTASFRQGSSDNDPWYIGSESAITTGAQAGSGTGVGETNSEYRYVTTSQETEDITGAVFTIPAEFPKGYQKFYMMKGEISQSQWVAFFNTLTTTQKSTRDITSSGAVGKNTDNLTYRNNVSWTSGDATLPDQGGGATYASVAMNYISWADLAAYLDWAGLRPMSELEFEKAARGPYRAVSGEYVWGSTSLTGATGVSNAGLPNEAPSAAANCVYNNGVAGPMRVGAMAYGDATRIASGAGYYGAMDLCGNVYERTVSVGRSEGRAFNGAKHGNGVLTSGGDADVTTWPDGGTAGIGLRGGALQQPWSVVRLSDRSGASMRLWNRLERGGRGVRSAP